MAAWFCSPRRLKELGVLGLNSRNLRLIAGLNNRDFYPRADNKLLTKELAQSVGIAVPDLYAQINFTGDLNRLAYRTRNLKSFVIKPASGAGGEGVLVINKQENREYHTNKRILPYADLRYHCAAILHGLHSLGGRPDKVMIEEKVEFDPLFDQLSYQGVPDIRVIVLKGKPIMAMLRLPTRASGGRANLHQGAIGVGIEMEQGLTMAGVHGKEIVEVHPDTKVPIKGVQLPQWKEVLEIASRCYQFSELGYLGVDIVYDRNKGPLLLEINARPGLAIQLANRTGLMRRVGSLAALK
ncbi:MAG: alpha-L-glutamate ligase-like protein [Bdellovibrionales bacterium]|nr:alpha-L-glutamate ligase-like protein [Bdellovibrionales bacterium]